MICTVCKTDKPLSEFYKRSGRGKTTTSGCRACLNKKRTLEGIKRKLQAIEYLGGSCKRCKKKYNYNVYDFHHRNPSEKESHDHDWSKIRYRSWDYIRQELDKCDLLCANCHREIHSVSLDLKQVF